MTKNSSFQYVHLDVSSFEYESEDVVVPGPVLFSKTFVNLGQAFKFIQKHKDTTFGCYRYTLDFW